MRYLRFSFFIFLLSTILIEPVFSDIIPVPELKTRVMDLTSTLDSQEIKKLNAKLEDFEKRKGSQIAVLIVPTTGDETIEQFGIKVAEKWKIGRSKIDDGVILIVAKNDRKLRIEVGYGLEGTLTDILSKKIIDSIITPNFKSGNFYKGISDGSDAIIAVIEGEELPASNRPTDQENVGILGPLVGLIFIFLAFVFGFFLTVFSSFVIPVIFILLIYKAAKNGSLRTSGKSSFGRSSYSSGYSSGSSSSSSSGSSSGGGGSFGGGGASGSW